MFKGISQGYFKKITIGKFVPAKLLSISWDEGTAGLLFAHTICQKKKKNQKKQFHIKPTCASEWKKDKYSTYYTHFKKGEKMLVATTCPILI